MNENEKEPTQQPEKDFTLSDSSRVNSKGFKVDLTGGRYDRFDSNPVMLYAHDDKHVIGYWENRRIDNGKLLAKPVFDLKDPSAAEIARKVKEGFLRGASLGILPIRMEQIGDDYVLTEWELLEASVTPIPSDAGAVRLYNEKREVITFEQLKLSFSNNNQISKTMDEKETIVLTAATRESLKLSASPTAKQIELAVQEKDDTIDKQKKEIATLKSAQIETYLSAAVKDGKIDEKEKAGFLKLAANDFDGVKSIIDAKQTNGSLSLKEMADKGKTNLGADDRASWTWLDWSKKDHKGLQRLNHDNPTEFERLKAEYKQSKKN